jgi:hypothetical protein
MKANYPLLIALVVSCLIGAAAADVIVIQDSCQVSGQYLIVYFSVENRELPMSVCTVTLFPDNYSTCFLVECGAPEGWSCYPGNETTFYAAASVPGECIQAGGVKHGFSAKLDTEACCFMVGWLAGDGSVLGTQDVCFHCPRVGIEPECWGHVKTLFQ